MVKGRKVKTLTESMYTNGKSPIRIPVQDHTTFIVDAKGRRTWRFRANTKSVKIDTDVRPSGDMAKDKAMFAEWSYLVRQGLDPRRQTNTQNVVPTFREVAEDHIANGLGHITNDKNRQQFQNTLRTYVYPELGHLKIDQIKSSHIYRCLRDLWYGNEEKGIMARQETANRTLGRIKAVFSRAMVLGYIDGANPAIYQGNLDALLKRTRRLESFKALDYGEMPYLVKELSQYNELPALALLWIIANVTRTGETLKASYDHVSQGRWVLPAEHTKTNKDFVVPLTEYTTELLVRIKASANGGGMLFPSPTKVNQPLSDGSLRNLMAELETQGWTKHGVRASFKTWAEEQTSAKNAVIESCLAHVTQGVEKHYMRGEYLELRRDLMEQWHKHLRSEL